MLRIENISYSVAGRPLIEDASTVIPTGHRVGVVGRNGTGKTTLFRLIRGELTLDQGRIETPRGARIGGVDQEAPSSDATPMETVLAADAERGALLAEAETAKDPARIAEIQTRLADIDAWSGEARAASILSGLGFPESDQRRPCSDFSGGWRMRIALAGVLFSAPDLLLLDEPTNYLDLEGAVWLENHLAQYPHTALTVSHDRGLLNRVVGSILHLEDRKLTLYATPYDGFAKARAARIATAEAESKRQEARRAHLQSYVDRFRYKADKARQAQSRLKAIARMEPITLPSEAALRRFGFPEPEELAPPILRLDGASAGYGDTVVLSRLDLRVDQDDRIALLGRNGQGKSTLSKLLAGRLPTMKGRVERAAKLRVGYFAQHQLDELRADETPLDHVRRMRPDEEPKRHRARLGGFGLGAEQAGMAAGDLSGGQKARLALMLATLDAPHLLILDEPTNHLDIESREALVEALTAYGGAVIIVSHDMHLLSHVVDRLWLVDGGRVEPFTDDLDGYRRMLLKEPVIHAASKPRPASSAESKRPTRDSVLALRTEARKAEERVEKLEALKTRMDRKLEDPDFYKNDGAEIERWRKKYAEVREGLDLAEALWMKALEKLEAAEETP